MSNNHVKSLNNRDNLKSEEDNNPGYYESACKLKELKKKELDEQLALEVIIAEEVINKNYTTACLLSCLGLLNTRAANKAIIADSPPKRLNNH